MSLSFRLKYISDLVSPCDTAADIGTDHALVPVYLLKTDRVKKAIAIDVSRDCLKKAQDSVIKYSLEGRLEPRLSDGLEKLLPGEADCVIVSGMGGILMCRILEKDIDITFSVKELVLSPHRDADLVRDFLKNNCFETVHDEIIRDKNKEYCVIKARNSRFFLKETL